MLRVSQDGYLPWQVTDDPSDAIAATSAEALTMIQLLSGVDMAGAILPPDVLARLVVLHCEDVLSSDEKNSDDSMEWDIVDYVQESLPDKTMSYSEAHPWTQSRVKLPQASLDELVIVPTSDRTSPKSFSLSCCVKEFGTITFSPTADNLAQVLYQYHPSTSMAFVSLALALRHKAPITVVNGAEQVSKLESIQKEFPMFATVNTLRQSSNRVQQDIVRGFEIHKLTGALRIAMERGDDQAAAKIRQELDKYDSMDALPTVPMKDDSLLVGEDEHDLDDDNVLQ
jgi:hypothetical protein